MRVFVWEHLYGAKTVYIAETVEEAQERQRACGACDDKERNPWGYQITHSPPSYSLALPCHFSILEGSVYSG